MIEKGLCPPKPTTEENHPKWKGAEVGYYGVHVWIKKMFGNPEKCEDCGKIGEKKGRKWNIEWSNCDHKYRRVKEDYIGRCVKCHGEYDKQHKLRNHANKCAKR